MTSAADFKIEDDTLRFSGSLTLARIGDLPARLAALGQPPSKVDLAPIERMDTVGAWLIHRLARDHDVSVEGANEEEAYLLEQVAAADKPVKIRPDTRGPLTRTLEQIGGAVYISLNTLLGLVGFFGAVLISFAELVVKPRRWRFNAVVRQFEVVGVEALGIVGLMSFLIGIVIAQQGAIQLRQFGAEVFTINLVGRLTFRELGVLMTAIMVAGRSGSAFAAQIGTMRITEEVDAMRTIGSRRWRL